MNEEQLASRIAYEKLIAPGSPDIDKWETELALMKLKRRKGELRGDPNAVAMLRAEFAKYDAAMRMLEEF